MIDSTDTFTTDALTRVCPIESSPFTVGALRSGIRPGDSFVQLDTLYRLSEALPFSR